MTIKEFYAQIGEDDQDVVKRLGSEALIRRLILKFPQDETFAALQIAVCSVEINRTHTDRLVRIRVLDLQQMLVI